MAIVSRESIIREGPREREHEGKMQVVPTDTLLNCRQGGARCGAARGAWQAHGRPPLRPPLLPPPPPSAVSAAAATHNIAMCRAFMPGGRANKNEPIIPGTLGGEVNSDVARPRVVDRGMPRQYAGVGRKPREPNTGEGNGEGGPGVH
ncbi:hypothetical protein RR46_09549 [Papilio xuthus]|uniref:Uncharacterized protein n=1 Tax=Papilio xuthus TaxID=66420 RepID=A0A194PZ65_PAPXU|nr:hypothetical protein RR46_09549 [Papilio xuthus]